MAQGRGATPPTMPRERVRGGVWGACPCERGLASQPTPRHPPPPLPSPCSLPIILMDLKGPAFAPGAIAAAGAAAAGAGVAPHAALFVLSPEQERVALAAAAPGGGWQGPLIRGFLVRACVWGGASVCVCGGGGGEGKGRLPGAADSAGAPRATPRTIARPRSIPPPPSLSTPGRRGPQPSSRPRLPAPLRHVGPLHPHERRLLRRRARAGQARARVGGGHAARARQVCLCVCGGGGARRGGALPEGASGCLLYT